jgi:hypothetical protein
MILGIWRTLNGELKNSLKNSKRLNLKEFALDVAFCSIHHQIILPVWWATRCYPGRTDLVRRKIESHFMLVRKTPCAWLRSDWWGYEITIPKSKMDGMKGAKAMPSSEIEADIRMPWRFSSSL